MAKADSLYKYTKLTFVNSSLNNGIFASSIDNLNDPYECDRIENPNNYKVVCLSRSRNKKLMWSHYADGHRGCAIKISVPDEYGNENFPLKRVHYTGYYTPRSNLSPNDVIKRLYTKDKKWDYELEVRAVYYNDSKNSTYWKKYRNNIFFKVNITQIDFGCFSHYDPQYLDALIAIRDYNTNHKKEIKVRKYMMSDKKYEFVINNNFDYIKEIAEIVNGK